MNNKNFLIGMGMGLTVGGCAAAMAMRPKKVKINKALKTVGRMADAVAKNLK